MYQRSNFLSSKVYLNQINFVQFFEHCSLDFLWNMWVLMCNEQLIRISADYDEGSDRAIWFKSTKAFYYSNFDVASSHYYNRYYLFRDT